MKRCLLFLLFLALAPAAHAAKHEPLVTQNCGCQNRPPMAESTLAFKGTITKIDEIRQDVRGFGFYFIDVTFKLEDAWRGVPDGQQEITVRTDTTSCGYGRIFVPAVGQNAIGGTYGVFAKDLFLNLCNSVVVDETWFPKNQNPFISEAAQPQKGISNWSKHIPDGLIDKELERLKEEKKQQEKEWQNQLDREQERKLVEQPHRKIEENPGQ